MIRVYLDWSIISSLKTEQSKELKELLYLYKDEIIIPYTPAHFDDLMRSYKDDNKFFEQDISLLENLTNNNFLEYNDNSGIINLKVSPRKYFEWRKNIKEEDLDFRLDKLKEDIKDNPLLYNQIEFLEYTLKSTIINNSDSDILKLLFPNSDNINSLYDIFLQIPSLVKSFTNNREFYKHFRGEINKDFKLESNSGNWKPEEVFPNINKHLVELEIQGFEHFIKSSIFKDNLFNKFVSYYCNLDIIGYQEDKLPKPNNSYKNILTDGEHAFYASSCDYFVVNDKILSKRAKAIFNYFKLNTKVITSQEFIEEVKNMVIDNAQNPPIDIFIESFNIYKENTDNKLYFEKKYNERLDEFYDEFLLKLHTNYLNYFNRLLISYYDKSKYVIFNFYHDFDNGSNVIYEEEENCMIDDILDGLGFNENENNFILIKNLIKNIDNNTLQLKSNKPLILISKTTLKLSYNLTYSFNLLDFINMK